VRFSIPRSLRVDFPLADVGEQVRRARDGLLRLAVARVDHRQHEAIRVGVRFDLDDVPDDDLLTVPHEVIGRLRDRAALVDVGRNADVFQRGDLQPGQRQAVGQFLDPDVDFHIIFQP
jgi:hypothetical protein